ncbi:uncharacterized protein LOC128993220 [Macrosteles quadrilineatus]|uniref:uncharacterized protein LOC128993220 n=1 Tax=Macrosteles quadrilineatus TaxID=74068 RepID=UPI0023E1A46E|nr:uncharacterized protein LOC128993220 [Macrosteles quadrilineatus]
MHDIMLQVHAEGKSKDPQVQVESEPLRRELEATRWRQVDVALRRKLELKEQELRSWRSLRDQQLSHVMRALMLLEARLRREQRNIRSLLGERDAVIRAQQQEIARLRKLLTSGERVEEIKSSTPAEETLASPPAFHYDCDVKPDLISSLGISHFRKDKSCTPTTTDNEDSQSNLDSLQLSFYELGSQPESLLSNLSTQSCDGDHDSEPCKDSDLRFSPKNMENHSEGPTRFHNNNCYPENGCRNQDFGLKKLEVKVHMEQYPPQKNVLSPVKEESLISIPSTCNSPSRCNPCEEQAKKDEILRVEVHQDCKPSPSTLLQEVRISGRNEYEDNPVLNCVNQILLRDQEEFLEEQRALRLKEQEKKKEAEAKLNNKKLTKSTENLTLLNDQIIVQHSHMKKVYPPLESVSNHTVIEQAIKETTENEFEEDHYKSINKLPTPKKLSLPKDNLQVKIVPPALPPKPQRLVLSKSLDQKTLLNTLLPALKGDDSDPIEMLKKRSSLPNPSPDSELYVISNSAIDDELLQRLQGRRIKSCSEPPTLSKSKLTSQSRENIYTPVVSHPTHKPPSKPTHSTSSHSKTDQPNESKVTSKLSSPTKTEETPRTPPKQSPKKIISPKSCIKVASPVSSLLNSGDAIEPSEETGKKTSPSVSQIVRRFEEIGSKPGKESDKVEENPDNIQKNFEEFRLDECDMDTLCGDGRPEGDGAENRANASAAVIETNISYENFLEATGLSQKSIMTPSRLFSNHKSVMKPKDVKHRSRVKAAAVVDRCNNAAASVAPGGSIVRYWTEPYL